MVISPARAEALSALDVTDEAPRGCKNTLVREAARRFGLLSYAALRAFWYSIFSLRNSVIWLLHSSR